MPIEHKTFRDAIKQLPISMMDAISNLFGMLKSRRMIVFIVVCFCALKYGMPLVKNANDLIKVLAFIAGVGLGNTLAVMAERRANGGKK